MQVDDARDEHAEEALIDGALRGGLSVAERARLDRHLAVCASCATELEAMRAFGASLAPGPKDEALNQVAVERAMARLGESIDGGVTAGLRDEALNQAAVERAMARLGARETLGARLRRLLRPSPGLAALGAAAGVAVVFALFHARRPAPQPATNAVPAGAVTLTDGSEIAPEDAATAIRVDEQTPARTTVHLSSGRARFRVRHDPRRLFRVDAGSIEIEDLGTVFRVAHETGGRIRVAVSEGRVAVHAAAAGLRVELGAGEERLFGGASETRDTLVRATEAAPAGPPPDPVQTTTPVHAQTHPHVSDDPADLLLAADVARRSHEPRAAVAPLRRLVERHPKDPRAPAAAFTLGWVLLTDLDRPREAAIAFTDAERIAPRGALAEDAAARVAEAWQKAGDSRRAAQAARHYTQMYPTGRYIALMRGLIGER